MEPVNKKKEAKQKKINMIMSLKVPTKKINKKKMK